MHIYRCAKEYAIYLIFVLLIENSVASDTNGLRRRRSAPTNSTYTVAVAAKGCRAYDPDFDAWVASGAVVGIWTFQ